MIKSRRMRWAGNVARMGIAEIDTGILWGKLTEIYYLGDPCVDGRII
jgi:hypothetical protein